jgi:hypothetical protein
MLLLVVLWLAIPAGSAPARSSQLWSPLPVHGRAKMFFRGIRFEVENDRARSGQQRYTVSSFRTAPANVIIYATGQFRNSAGVSPYIQVSLKPGESVSRSLGSVILTELLGMKIE